MSDLDMNQIIKIAAKAGAEVAIQKIQQKELKDEEALKDWRLKNTRLLLSHYREFSLYSENAIYKAEQSEDIIDILDLMWSRHNRAEQVVESIKSSAIRTKIVMTHIDGMIAVYKTMCENSHNPMNKRRFDVMKMRYIDDVETTMDEIAAKFNVDVRTAYLDLDYAVETMAKLIFGIDWIMSKKNNRPKV